MFLLRHYPAYAIEEILLVGFPPSGDDLVLIQNLRILTPTHSSSCVPGFHITTTPVIVST